MEKRPQKVSTSQQSTSTPSQRSRIWPILVGTIAALVCKLYLSRRASVIPTAAIPNAYAICTPSTSIYTVDEGDSVKDCILIENGTILAVGSARQIQEHWSAHYPSTPLKTFETPPGSAIVPGLADAHAHVLSWGAKEQLPLEDCTSIDDVVLQIKLYLLAHPDVLHDHSRWIVGMGWDQTKWPGGEFPTAEDLHREPLLRGRHIILSRVDVHAYWVSNVVLSELSNLPESVDGGIIVRDKSGKPTGVFVDNAMALVEKPEPTDAETLEYFETAMRDALRVGLTSIHDAATSPSEIAFFRRQVLADEGRLPIKLYLMGNVPSNDYWGDQIPRLIDHGPDKHLTVRSVKLFTDGALGSWGAALIEPYSDKPDTQGLLRSRPETLRKLAKQFHADNFQVNIHAIGDRANEVVLDIFEDVLSQPGADVDQWRPRVEHTQILQPSDFERIRRLGVLASVQPTHATSDMNYAEARLGPERIRGAYAYQSLLQASPGKRLPLGSDFPVEGINPLLGFYAAVARRAPDGTSPHGPGGWYPAEALTRTQALRGMTRDAAYAAFAEHARGQLARGFAADFVVLDRDIMQVPLEEILGARVLATVVDGKVAYGSL
ncbi:amidohydrolase family-domain-containing protein [Gloeopeniophorella convolvens]|nr:amidohydrolase family-domain-containing protein [Gloeopeniophorella convolvens]